MSQKPQSVEPAAHVYKSCSELCYLTSDSRPEETYLARVLELVEYYKLDNMLAKLLEGLDNAFVGGSSDQSVESQRAQYVAALAAIHRFLRRVAPNHAEHFLIIGDALADLNLGVVWPIIAKSKPRKSNVESRRKFARAYVVAALDVLIDSLGIPKEEAAKEVLKKFPAIIHLAAGRSKSWKQSSNLDLSKMLLRWRTDLYAPSRPKSDLVKSILTSGREAIEEFEDGSTPDHLRKFAYKCLRTAERVAVSLTDPVRLSKIPLTQLWFES